MYKFLAKNKLVSQPDLKLVFKNARKFNYNFLTILYHPNESNIARLGVIIAKRYVKLAVLRNCIRRNMRESFRLHQHNLCGLDIVVVFHAACPKPVARNFKVYSDYICGYLTKSDKI